MEQKIKKNSRKIFLLFLDAFLVVVSGLLALEIRFDFNLSNQHLMYRIIYLQHIGLYTVIMLGTIFAFGLYRSLWRYASISELLSVSMAAFWSNTALLGIYSLLEIKLPRSFYIINVLLIMMTVGGMRFSYRILRRFQADGFSFRNRQTHQDMRVLIVGAGEAAYMTSKELTKAKGLKKTLVGFLDDDVHKVGRLINGVKVLGKVDDVAAVIETYLVDEVIVALPSATNQRKREILEQCKNLGVRMKILPGIYELIDGKVDVKKVRDVEIEDLLGRDPVKLDNTKIGDYIKNKVIFVTGGGGSIGSELCRQIAGFAPKKLVIFDIYENTAYEIQNELLKNHPELDLTVLIGSVRDEVRLEEVFERHKPNVVFHAAAHKHVPLMQNSPFEAIKNNTLGTYNTARIAAKNGVERFILISTDKAVNPTNIMGASKRLAELVIQLLNTKYSSTEFMAVRFGNVLGSNGSVIPLFKKQIESGGPITVTHPDIIRYFMTIPEAVQLVLQTGTMARGGEIFVLDMGEPVKIVTLAEDLIKLSGFEPYEDIGIVFSGLRPGEKLYEELLLDDEGIANTVHEKIFIGRPLEFSADIIENSITALKAAIQNSNVEALERTISTLIPTYRKISTESE